MLLSDNEVANYLKRNFVLTWREVRPAPKITIDYGNGEVLTRTLKGNTAFYVCRPDGQVVDILPGVLSKSDFLEVLDNESLPLTKLSDQTVAEWHKNELQPRVAVSDLEAMIGKGRVESPILERLDLVKTDETITAYDIKDLSGQPASDASLKRKFPNPIEADSKASMNVLRPAVHSYLAEQSGLKKSKAHSRTVFRDILKVDLDDPYLGLRVRDVPGTD